MVERLWRNAAILAGIAIGIAAALLTVWLSPAFDGARVQSAPALPEPLRVAKEHGCWSGPAPDDMQGKLPGHVVVMVGQRQRVRYAGPRMVEKALDQVFHHHDHGLRVVAFCR